MCTVFADGTYGGGKLAAALKQARCSISVEVVKKAKRGKEFAVIPRRWVVERSVGWLRRCRRLSMDFGRSIASALAWLQLALIRVFMRRLGRNQVTLTA